MAYSHSRSYGRVRRIPKDIDPVVDLTLILLGTSTSNKHCVAKHIQYHLKGYIPQDDEPATVTEHILLNGEPVTETNCTLQNGEPKPGTNCTLQNGEPKPGTNCTLQNGEPKPTVQVPRCRIYEGKVLGLKTKTVITPDEMDDVTENEEIAIAFTNYVRQFVSGEYVIVLVTETKNKRERMRELEQLLCLINSIFDDDIQKYSLVVLTCSANNTEVVTDLTKVQIKSCRRNTEQEDISPMTFDINAGKIKNDRQVQKLLNQAKTIVKKKREECPKPVFTPVVLPDTGRSTQLASSSSVDITITTSEDDGCPGEDSMSDMTLDNLYEEDRKLLDECCEVYDYDAIFPSSRREEEVCLLAEYDSSPRNISFVTANPVGFGDYQC